MLSPLVVGVGEFLSLKTFKGSKLCKRVKSFHLKIFNGEKFKRKKIYFLKLFFRVHNFSISKITSLNQNLTQRFKILGYG